MQIHMVLIYCNLLCAIQGLDPISIKTTDYNLINTNLVVVHLLPNHFHYDLYIWIYYVKKQYSLKLLWLNQEGEHHFI